jgi:hypothetical protein
VSLDETVSSVKKRACVPLRGNEVSRCYTQRVQQLKAAEPWRNKRLGAL